MLKRLFLIVALCVATSGCFMAPMVFIGPVTSGFSTASIIQSGISSGANYMVKKSTGKSIAEHALTAMNNDILVNAYFPSVSKTKKIPFKNK